VASFGVEPVVSVVYLAKQNGHSLFKEGQLWGKLGLGHLKLLWTGRSRMALFLSYKPRNTHLVMAAMVLAMAMPAFAAPPKGCTPSNSGPGNGFFSSGHKCFHPGP
jgi:hypothetical protein